MVSCRLARTARREQEAGYHQYSGHLWTGLRSPRSRCHRKESSPRLLISCGWVSPGHTQDLDLEDSLPSRKATGNKAPLTWWGTASLHPPLIHLPAQIQTRSDVDWARPRDPSCYVTGSRDADSPSKRHCFWVGGPWVCQGPAAGSSPGASSCKDQSPCCVWYGRPRPKLDDNLKITCKPKSSECLQTTRSTAGEWLRGSNFPQWRESSVSVKRPTLFYQHRKLKGNVAASINVAL